MSSGREKTETTSDMSTLRHTIIVALVSLLLEPGQLLAVFVGQPWQVPGCIFIMCTFDQYAYKKAIVTIKNVRTGGLSSP